MNNVIKSVLFAAIVLVAGIAAMQAVYENVTGGPANIEPAAGSYSKEPATGAFNAPAESYEAIERNIDTAKEDAAKTAQEIMIQTSEGLDKIDASIQDKSDEILIDINAQPQDEAFIEKAAPKAAPKAQGGINENSQNSPAKDDAN